MIDMALIFLKDRLNAHLGLLNGNSALVTFPEGEVGTSTSLKLDVVSQALISVEREQVMRPADPYVRATPDGDVYRSQPEIRLNLWVLFAANFSQYENSLKTLSQILGYFQSNPVFDHKKSPSLDEKIEKLIMELLTPSIEEQREIWNALGTCYRPSALYRVKMITLEDSWARVVNPIKEIKGNVVSSISDNS